MTSIASSNKTQNYIPSAQALQIDSLGSTLTPETRSYALALKAINAISVPSAITDAIELESTEVTTPAKTLVVFYNALPILDKPVFKGTMEEQASQIDSWLQSRNAMNLGIEDNTPTQPLSNLIETEFIQPYNMLKVLGFPNETTIKVARAAHTTAPTFGPCLSTLLQKIGAVPQDIDIIFPHINPTELTNEVQNGIMTIRESGKKNISVAVTLLQNAYPTSLIEKIRNVAMNAIANSQGLALPGGPNIESEFYDDTHSLHSPQDYRRTIGEFALIEAAHYLKKPIMGTCRGAQGINVFFGGTLKNIDNQKGWQKIELNNLSRKQQLETLMQGSEFTGYAFHGQACDKIAPGFEVVAHHINIPTVIMSTDGLVIGTQVHPEKEKGETYSNAIRIYELFFQQMLPQRPIAARL